MSITVYSYSHRSSAVSALQSVEDFLTNHNLPYNLVKLKDSDALPVSQPLMRQICMAEDPDTTIFKTPRGMSIDDWTITDVLARPNKSLKSPLTVETDDSGHVVHVMAGINNELLGLFIPKSQRQSDLKALLDKADTPS